MSAPVTDLSAIDCIGYLRVSDESQADERRTSLDDQRAAILDAARKRGLAIGYWFVDPGASGGTVERRRGLLALLASCEAHPRSATRPGIVLALNASRWGRFDNPEEAGYWRFHLERVGWIVRFAENDETDNLEARHLTRAIYDVQASAYRQQIRRNAKRGAHGTAANGYWQSRAPYGFRRKVVYPPGRERVLDNRMRKAVDERVQLVPVENEARIILEIFQKYAGGTESIASLTEWLLVHAPKPTSGRTWTKPAVRFLLSNPAYAGDVICGRVPSDRKERKGTPRRPEALWTVTRDAHPAIVTRSLFDAAQRRLAGNKLRTRGVRSDWVVSGLVLCPCGAPFAAGGGGGRPKHGVRIPCYRCSTRGQHVSAQCAYPGTITKHALEGAVISTVASVVSSSASRRRIAQHVDAAIRAQTSAPDDRTAELRRAEASIAERRARIVAAIESGVVSHLDARERMATLHAEERRVRRDLDQARQRDRDRLDLAAVRDQLVTLASDFARVAKALSGPALREHLRPWIDRAEFNTRTRVLTMAIRHLPALNRDLSPMISGGMAPDRAQNDASGQGKSGRRRDVTVRRVVVGRARRSA